MSESNASPQTPYGNGTDGSGNNGYAEGYSQTPASSRSGRFGQSPYVQRQDRQGSGTPSYGRPYCQTPQYGQQYGQQYGRSYGQSAPGQSPYSQPTYGQPEPGWYPAYDEPSYQRWNILSIVGFVLAFPIPPVGLVLSIIALVQINASREKSRGLAIAGTVVGAINTMLLTIVIVIAVIAFGQVMDYAVTNYDRDGYGYADDNGDYGDVATDCVAELDGRCYEWDDLDDYMEDYLRKYGKRPSLDDGNVGDRRASLDENDGDAVELIDVPVAAWTH